MKQAWRTLRWTSAALFMVLLDGTILFVAFPSIRRSFPSILTSDLSWILNAYTVVYAALLAPAGRMADRWGRRRVFLQGVGIFVVGYVVVRWAMTSDAPHYLSRWLLVVLTTGVGVGLLMP